jgi:hypothetical protein
MKGIDKRSLRIAILDLYEGEANQGMRCLREIIAIFGSTHQLNIQVNEFNVRQKCEVPGLDYDIYISSGGPGSPLDSEGSDWENNYFSWLEAVENFNADLNNRIKKQIFLICHSLQLVTRHYNIATVNKRKSTSFGVFPVHILLSATNEPIFNGLSNPFYAVDSRDYQIVQPNNEKIKRIGASILSIEKERPHVPLERAIMAIRFNENMIGTQFHPEADAEGMLLHLMTDEKKQTVIENHGAAKWASMIEQLNDPEKIMHTYLHILPNFLEQSINKIFKENLIAQ